MGPGFWHSERFKRVLQNSSQEIYYPIYFHNKMQESQWFVDDFLKRSNQQPSSLAAMTYDSMKFVLSLGPHLETNKDFSRFFRKQKKVPGILGNLSMSRNRFVSFPAIIVKFDKNIFKPEKIISF